MTEDGSGTTGRPGDGSSADKLWWYQDVRQLPPPIDHERKRAIRRRRALDVLACLSLSTLCFSQARSDALFGAHWNFYSRVPLGGPTLVALLLNVVGLAALGVVAVEVSRRIQRPGWRRVAAVVAAAALLVALNFARLAHETVARWTDALGLPALVAVVVLGLVAALGWPHPVLVTVRRLALIGAPLGVFTLVHTVWMFLELAAGPIWRWVDPTPLTQAAPSLRRVVWVVFSELDQRLIFEARPASLELPELDRLRRDSVYAHDARPPAGTTDVSMPALITGRPVVAVAPESPTELTLTFADGTVAPWSSYPNVFSRARVLGYDTAVIGWRLPYPRVLGRALGLADWRSSITFDDARGDTLVRALGNQWGSLVPPVHLRRTFARRVAELGELAIRTGADGRFALVLLHLPLPRPPAIYDRAAGALTPWNFAGPEAAYLDNLALADRMLSELRRALERTRLDDRTWIIVSSDRWRPAPPPDAPVDRRVPFLLRPPAGGRTAHVDAVFNTLTTHDLVLAILRGAIHDLDTATDWIARQQIAPPRDYTSLGRPIY